MTIKLASGGSVALSLGVGLAAVSLVILATTQAHSQVGGSLPSFVRVQSATPGTPDMGNANVSGRVVAGSFEGSNAVLSTANAAASAIVGTNTARTTIGALGTPSAAVVATSPGSLFSITSARGTGVANPVPNSPGIFASADVYGIIGYGRVGGVGAVGAEAGGFAVYAQSIPSTSTAIRGQNDQTGEVVDISGPEGAVYIRKGTLYRNYGTSKAAALPIAYGMVDPGGVIANGSGNFSVVWNATNLWYEVTIPGETFSIFTHSATATRAGFGLSATAVDSVGEKLLVYITNSSGARVQSWFGFTAYKSNPNSDSPSVPRHRYLTDSLWSEAEPEAASAWMRSNVATIPAAVEPDSSAQPNRVTPSRP